MSVLDATGRGTITPLLQLRRQMSKLIKRETEKKGDSSFIIVIKSRLFSAYSCVFAFCSFARHSGALSLSLRSCDSASSQRG